MPLPTPGADEGRTDFIQRFMGSDAMQKEYPKHKQRLAVAFSQWRQKSLGRATKRLTGA